MNRTFRSSAWAWLLAALTAAGTPALASDQAPETTAAEAVEQAGLSAYQHVAAPGLVLAGRLDDGALARLAGRDVLVVDLRTPGEGIDSEAEAARSLGIDYHNVPVSGTVIDPAQVQRLDALLSEAEGRPVVVHCASGNRAAMLWGAVQLQRGAELEQVMDAVAPIATKPPVTNALRNFAAGRAAADEAEVPESADR